MIFEINEKKIVGSGKKWEFRKGVRITKIRKEKRKLCKVYIKKKCRILSLIANKQMLTVKSYVKISILS